MYHHIDCEVIVHCVVIVLSTKITLAQIVPFIKNLLSPNFHRKLALTCPNIPTSETSRGAAEGAATPGQGASR